jgi:hypothetical protein
MKIFVKAKPRAKEEKVEQTDPPSPKGFGRTGDMHFVVSVKEPALQGKVNRAITKALAQQFNVSLSRVELVSGYSSRQKVFEIL